MRNSWWRVSLMWIVAGFLFPLLTPVTEASTALLQPFFTSALGLADDLLAYRVTFTLVRVPLTGLFGLVVAAGQCASMPGGRSLARRWLIASAVGGTISTLALLPVSLVLVQIMTRKSFVLVGALFFSVFVSFLQRSAARKDSGVPQFFVISGVLGTTVGAFLGLFIFM